MYSQPRFSLVTPEQVRGHLKATGSSDPDVLLAAKDQLSAPYKPLKWFGIWGIVTGSLCCLLIVLAFIGIPLVIFGIWALKRSKKNAATIEAAFSDYVGSLSGTARPGTIGVRTAGIIGLLALVLAGQAAAQNEQVEPEWRGDYVAATATCSSPVRLRLGVDRMTLINGRDSAVFRDLDFTSSYYGQDYQGIQFVSMPDYTRSSNSADGYPFLVQFNDGERKGTLRILDPQPSLRQRFPLAERPLKPCGARAPAGAVIHQAPGCQGEPRCDEGTTFAASVADVRTSVSGRDRLVAVTLRIRNRMNHPLTLAYVQNSGVITDDRGNRYVVYGPTAVRGLGEIAGSRVDPKFTLPAGETADARLEFLWRPTSGAIYGTVYDLDVALRELEPLPADQWQLGREHALQYRGLGPSGSQAPAAQAAMAAPPAKPNAGAAETAASCGTRVRCVASGSFTAEVTNVVPSQAGRHHVLQLSVKITNASAQPLILGYTSASSGAVDNLGNRYYFGRAGTHDVSFRGIGLVTSRAADPQFQVPSGGSRTATFTVTRFEASGKQLGTSWTWDVALEELETLPGSQVRSLRQHAVSFPDLTAAGAAPSADAAGSLIKGVKSLFGGKKKD
ncbi:MAG TPA: hypothetical protein VFO96_07355 [Gemmatimonadales bacterium]|jgi:hypothetical protein|nr:hypothetical protein [Gemmatimonadales bacterium]